MATKWGIVSAGKISHDFVTAVRSSSSDEHEFVAVAARHLNAAQEFAIRHEISKAYGSYEAIAKDPDVEVAYVGTVTAQHFAVGKMMLEAGKHVLMEKPMTLNAKQTKTLIQLAKKHKRFLMEAIWSRFFPAYQKLEALLRNGAVGRVMHVSATFGQPLVSVYNRLMHPSLGTGTVMDLGIYTLNAVCAAYGGQKPEKIAAVGYLNENGVDVAMSGSLLFSEGRTAQVTTNALADLPCDLLIMGTQGQIKVPGSFWCPTRIETANETFDFPLPDTIFPCHFVNSSGLRYEAAEVRRCLKEGLLESSVIPLKDSEMFAEIMDEIRRQIGVTYEAD